MILSCFYAMSNALLLYIFLCSIFIFLWKKKRLLYFSFKVSGPISIPLIGNPIIIFGRDVLNKLLSSAEKYQEICKFWFWGKLIFVVSSPDYIQIVLNKCLEKEESYRFLELVLSRGLFTTPGNKWKKRRQIIESILNEDVVDEFLTIFKNNTKILTEKFKKKSGGEYFDVMPVMTQCFLDILFGTVLGTKTNVINEESKTILDVKEIFEFVLRRPFNVFLRFEFFWNFLFLSQKSEELNKRIDLYFKAVLESKRNTIFEKQTILDYLLAENLPDDEVLAETRTLIITGTDSLATTISFCLILLAMHQEIQDEIYNELKTVFCKNKNLVLSDFTEMRYLERAIKETLRLFPVYRILGREVDTDLTLGPFTLPKGSSVIIPILALHRSPKHWPEPLKFNPDRFLSHKNYIPFGCSPRNCLGQKYAILALKTVLASVLYDFRVTTRLKSVGDIKMGSEVVTRSTKGYPIKFEERNNVKHDK